MSYQTMQQNEVLFSPSGEQKNQTRITVSSKHSLEAHNQKELPTTVNWNSFPHGQVKNQFAKDVKEVKVHKYHMCHYWEQSAHIVCKRLQTSQYLYQKSVFLKTLYIYSKILSGKLGNSSLASYLPERKKKKNLLIILFSEPRKSSDNKPKYYSSCYNYNEFKN